ncbi:MAG: CRISPR-associated endoribonuclease Cas6 [Eubacteriales bacterium]|nr:CRISPR-associated endoribonuclease Cas6 [Eubacteriales bacterium]MDD4390553.1 CRISPR-associated endoribonuclease Cas6 [Eubacteriales bacterium]
MRISAEFLLGQNKIDRDSNRIFISILKSILGKYDKVIYKSFFEMGSATKPYCFSLHMKDGRLAGNEIKIPSRKITFKISTISLESGLHIYNAFVQSLHKIYYIAENSFTLNDVNIEREKKIYDNEAVFTALSPVVIRKYEGIDREISYFSLNEEEGKKLLMGNLKKQILKEFGEDNIIDIDYIEVDVLFNKEVNIKNYGTDILANVCNIRIFAKPYILNYIHKAGIGGHKRTGFGMMGLQ